MPVQCEIVNMTQLLNEAETNEQKQKRHYVVAKQNGVLKAKHATEKDQFNKRFSKWKPNLLKLMEKYKFMWDGHLEKISVAKHCITLNPSSAGLVQTASYRVGPRQRVL